MIESNYLEMAHKWEYINGSTNFILKTAKELNHISNINKTFDRDLNDTEIKEIEKEIEHIKTELDRLKHLINVRWTRF